LDSVLPSSLPRSEPLVSQFGCQKISRYPTPAEVSTEKVRAADEARASPLRLHG